MTVSPLCSNETIEAATREGARLCYSGWDPYAEARDMEERATARERGRRAAADYRLVKGSKSPTRPEMTGEAASFLTDWTLAQHGKPLPVLRENEAPHWGQNVDQPGTWAVMESRPWAGEWRLRTETRPPAGSETPDQAGDRITAMLSHRGARKIADACYYVATKRGGFTTFLTLTLTPEAREKLARRTLEPLGQDEGKTGWYIQHATPLPIRAKQCHLKPIFDQDHQVTGEDQDAQTSGPYTAIDPDTCRPFTPVRPAWVWSVQREASRFLEAMGKMYQRGWQYEDAKGRTVKVKGSPATFYKPATIKSMESGRPVTPLEDGPYSPVHVTPEPLDYLWVAENPDRIDQETGELIGENPHLHVLLRWRVPFRHFQAWAERVEKLWGNGMAHLEKIKEPAKAGAYVAKAAGYLTKAQYGDKNYQGRIRGNRYAISQRARAPGWVQTDRWAVGVMGWLLAEANEAWNNRHGPKIAKREYLKDQLAANDAGKERQKIGRLLEGVRKELEALPRLSKYQAVFKEEQQKDQFITWARRRGWQQGKQSSLWLVKWRAEQWRRRHAGRLQARAQDVAAWFALADSGAVMTAEDIAA